MKQIIYPLALVALVAGSCQKDVLEHSIPAPNMHSPLNDDANRPIRPLVLGEQKQNPFSLENMRIALDTLRGVVGRSDQLVMKSQSVDGLQLEATDLYVRFLPQDSAQHLGLMNDTTLVLYDFPLDHEIAQAGDYYMDPTVSNGFTWYYSVVKPGYQPPPGIRYEVIEELFIPENHESYRVVAIPRAKRGGPTAGGHPHAMGHDILAALYIISFTLTGNDHELKAVSIPDDTPPGDDPGAAIQKVRIDNCWSHSLRIFGRTFTWTTCDPYYLPDGTITIQTPGGDVGAKGLIVRMRRWFTTVDARTNEHGQYLATESFNSILVGNNVWYQLVFNGLHPASGNRWTLNRTLLGGVTLYTNSQCLGTHSPNGLTVRINDRSSAWGRGTVSNAVYDYCGIAHADGVALPPQDLEIANRETSSRRPPFPRLPDGALKPDLMVHYSLGVSSYSQIVADAWHTLIFTSLYSRVAAQMGRAWARASWGAVHDQLQEDEDNDLLDCSCVTTKQGVDHSQQVVLWEAWANHRKEELLRAHLRVDPKGLVTENPYITPYVGRLRRLRALGCTPGDLETALCTRTIEGFRANLLNRYPHLSGTINTIPNPSQRRAGEVTFLTYNLKKQDYKKHARTIACVNPDVVALQEVRYSGNFDDIKKETGMNGEMIKTNYHQGIVLLWRPSLGTPRITTKQLEPLSNSSDREDRAYIIAEFSNFCFISTHFSTDQDDRSRMTDSIIKHAKAMGKPVYLGGDLNEQPHGPAIAKLREHGFVVLNHPGTNTFPSSNPHKLIDMILGYRSGSTEHTIVSRGIPGFPRADLRSSSDHLPYFVTVRLH